MRCIIQVIITEIRRYTLILRNGTLRGMKRDERRTRLLRMDSLGGVRGGIHVVSFQNHFPLNALKLLLHDGSFCYEKFFC